MFYQEIFVVIIFLFLNQSGFLSSFFFLNNWMTFYLCNIYIIVILQLKLSDKCALVFKIEKVNAN